MLEIAKSLALQLLQFGIKSQIHAAHAFIADKPLFKRSPSGCPLHDALWHHLAPACGASLYVSEHGPGESKLSHGVRQRTDARCALQAPCNLGVEVSQMWIGMIGPGRMGASMVRGPLTLGHTLSIGGEPASAVRAP